MGSHASRAATAGSVSAGSGAGSIAASPIGNAARTALAGGYQRLTHNPVVDSGLYNTVTNNGFGMGLGTVLDAVQNGRAAVNAIGGRMGSLGRSVLGGLGSLGAEDIHHIEPTMSTDLRTLEQQAGYTLRTEQEATRVGRAVAGGPGRVLNGALGIVGVHQGVNDLIGGVRTARDGRRSTDERVAGGLQAAGGAAGATSGAIGTLQALGVEAAVGGTGALGLGTSVAAAGALPVAAAGATGLAGGLAIAGRGSSYMQEVAPEILGWNSDGTPRGWSDWAAEMGIEAQQASGSEVVGGAAALAATIPAAAGAAVTGVAGLATDLASGVGALGTGAWNAARGWWGGR